ncbi:MAG: STAS domain-containing protein [Bacteroidetes bacterium]|jgi:anti-sigma B factor antagonist|nr:STAS domain-containing protein [Bacteroidota bacterium]
MMQFSSKEVQGVTVISLSGNVLGGPDANTLNDQLHGLLETKKTKVIIDLGDVQFINSSGLGMLIGGMSTMRKGGGELKLARASKKVLTLLEMTKLTNLFDVHETVKAAVGAFK